MTKKTVEFPFAPRNVGPNCFQTGAFLKRKEVEDSETSAEGIAELYARVRASTGAFPRPTNLGRISARESAVRVVRASASTTSSSSAPGQGVQRSGTAAVASWF